ncbi:MAG TPA: hypothetical protein VMM18_13315 [Gemmatimonadaceae bacterium]|nr:hypothetical protein [Gemmatimonadaceae bacterium]
MRLTPILTLLLVLQSAGCYYAVIDTGRPQSIRTVEEAWAPAYVGGMVAPRLRAIVERCPHGAARVEAHRSAGNLLVTALTLGVYAPTTVRVTCALEQSRSGGPPARIAD